ncbi:MAG: HIT family protein [Candidatus Bathyarchaeota archaeon]|nr:HIT family protein [Candidatus Bathyarchaeota archaeon]
MKSTTENCIFCKIIRREAHASIVYEDEQVIAFLSNHPVNVGHTLVVPKKHYVNIFDIPEDEAAYLYKITKRIAHTVKDATDVAGIRIVQNNGEAAGQVIFHLHVHIIPMKPHNQNSHDGAYRDKTKPRSSEELESDAEKIRHALMRPN